MGCYLQIGTREVTSKNTVCLMKNIILNLFPDLEKEKKSWKLKKKHIAKLIDWCNILLRDDKILGAYIGRNNIKLGISLTEVRYDVEEINRYFIYTLVDMVLYKHKFVKVKWI